MSEHRFGAGPVGLQERERQNRLELTNPFDQYVFIEKNAHRAVELQTMIALGMHRLQAAVLWPRRTPTTFYRAGQLTAVPAAVRFLSCEPLLGPLEDLPLAGIHWVIVGGESGPKARPMRGEWVKSILNQCRAARVPFSFKQWGGVRKDRTGRELHGRTYDEMPVRSSATSAHRTTRSYNVASFLI